MKKTYMLGVALLTPLLISSVFGAKTELESAQKLASMGVIKNATSESEFGLSQTITRKEMMKVTLNLSGKNVPDTCNGTFGDVTNDWGCKYIEAGLANGLIAANTNFRPNDTISKAEAMKLMLGARGIEKSYNTANWQEDWMKTALDNGIIASAYSDHNSPALRGWIFSVGAAEKSDVMDDTMMDDKMMKDEGDTMEDTMVKNTETGYRDYDSSLVGKNDTTVIFFHAAWCPSCRTVDTNLSDSGAGDILILKADYDSETDLRKKYGVTTQHTFVQIDENGELIKKWVGGNTLDDISEKL